MHHLADIATLFDIFVLHDRSITRMHYTTFHVVFVEFIPRKHLGCGVGMREHGCIVV